MVVSVSTPASHAPAIPQPPTNRGSVGRRAAVPVLLVLATLAGADFLRWVFPASGVFLLLLLPVLLASTSLGPRWGLGVLFAGAAGAIVLVATRAHPWLTEPSDALRLAPYLVVGGLIVIVATWRGSTTARRAAAPRDAADERLIEPLTSRELEVLALAASGLSTRQIGDQLYLSRNTVKSHLAHVYSKLGAHNRAEAVAAGLHVGTLDGRSVTSRAPLIIAGLTRPVRPGSVRTERRSNVAGRSAAAG